MNRRQFLSSAAGMGLASAAEMVPYADQKPRRVGLIGSGWYGKSDLLRLIQIAPVEVVSLCDVDKRMLAEAADIVASRQASRKKPRTFTDYREMLAQKDLELVEVATPDHWHALPAIAAIQAGCDVYLQKPVSVDVVEGQAILAAARKHNRVVQIGTQRRSTPHLIEARDRFLRTGMLGKIAYVHTHCYYHMRNRNAPPETAPPEYLDYDAWTGPAPMRPFTSNKHPRGWRAYMEYGNGIVGDMGVHMIDMARWMLDLGAPTRVSSTGGILMDKSSGSNISDTQTVTLEFPDLSMLWEHRTWGASLEPDQKYQWGATFFGDKGTLKASVYGYEFTPIKGERIQKDVQYEFEQYPEDKTEKDLERHVAPAIRGHMRDWLAAVDKRSRPVADIEEGHISTTACILANLSLQLGRTLQWDNAKGRVVGDEEANRLLARPYRKGYEHPDPAKV